MARALPGAILLGTGLLAFGLLAFGLLGIGLRLLALRRIGLETRALRVELPGRPPPEQQGDTQARLGELRSTLGDARSLVYPPGEMDEARFGQLLGHSAGASRVTVTQSRPLEQPGGSALTEVELRFEAEAPDLLGWLRALLSGSPAWSVSYLRVAAAGSERLEGLLRLRYRTAPGGTAASPSRAPVGQAADADRALAAALFGWSPEVAAPEEGAPESSPALATWLRFVGTVRSAEHTILYFTDGRSGQIIRAGTGPDDEWQVELQDDEGWILRHHGDRLRVRSP